MRRATWIIIGASLIIGTAVGCQEPGATADGSSTSGVVTAHLPTASAAAFGRPLKRKTKHKAGKSQKTQPTPTPTLSPTDGQTATGTAGAPTSAPTTDPTTDPTTPAQTSAGGAAFTASCPAQASTSAPGCGSWDAGASSGQAPGFAAGQQSSPNLLGVNQDPWTGSQGPQLLTASSFQDWSVTATDTDPSNAPGEVLTYPDASYNYYQLASTAPAQYDLNNITSLTSDFSESMPQLSDLNAEAAYDMWLNNWATEVMVWVDTSPAKDRNLADDGMTETGTYTYDGQNFALWHSGTGINGFYVFLLDHNETSGTVDLKAMLETMVSLGYIPAASPLTQIPFGWEVSDTGGQPVTFSMSKFDVNLQN
jgi:hypothetical protein